MRHALWRIAAEILLTSALLAGALFSAAPRLALAQASGSGGYSLKTDSPATDVGVQPLGVPSGVISAVISRDRILKKALVQRGAPLETHPFPRGPDIVPLLADLRLEAGLLGDMPTLLATAEGKAVIVGLVKQTSTAVVGRNLTRVEDLTGKRIGYVELSSAHHTLLQALRSAGVNEDKVSLVPLAVNAMPDALERGEIDAFAGWEPAPSIALNKNRANRIVFRGLSKDYLVFARGLVERDPEAARLLSASLARAIEWMRRSRSHAEQAIVWAQTDVQAFSGKPHALSKEQILNILRQEILDIPSAPVIPNRLGSGLLKSEFEFLAYLGKLPAGAYWSRVEDALRYDGLAQVLSERTRYRIDEFDYAD